MVVDLMSGPTPTPAITMMNLGRPLTAAEIALIPAVIGSSGNDVLTGRGTTAAPEANSLVGGAGNDSIFGLAGADTLRGGDGDDTIEGGAGPDSLDGGMHMGGDVVSYASSSAAGVTVDLAASTATGGDAANDVIANFEHVLGSDFADSLVAAAGTAGMAGSSLLGGAGNDNLVSGAGSDTLAGGADTDGVDYTASSGAVTVSLADMVAEAGGNAGGRCADRYRIGDRLEHGGFVAGRHGGRDADRRDGR